MECFNFDKIESLLVFKIYGDFLFLVVIFVFGFEVEINVCF